MKSMASRFIATLTLLLASTSVIAADCGASTDPCGTQIQWSEFESMHLQSFQVGTPSDLSSYLQSSRENGDFRIDVDIFDAKQPQHGTIMMVAGRVMVSKGLILTPGTEIDALDQPLLSLILVGKVLGRALPAGPGSVLAPQKVSHLDTTAGIQFATPSAQRSISPPWSVEGTVKPRPDHSFDFDLLLKWSGTDAANARHAVSMSLKGNLKHQSGFRLDDSMALDGWSVFSTGTRLDHGAKPASPPSHTIGDIRRQLEDAPVN
jgi:hypothetical protein